MNRRTFLGFPIGAALLRAADEHGGAPGVSPAQVHEELVRGNRRFLSGRAAHPHSTLAWMRTQAASQHPHAAILCCADSRVAPEILFDQGIGDLFVVRVAGNVAKEDELASLEYAIEHFNVPLLLVLGHSNCGAVTAVVKGAAEPVEIQHLVAPIAGSFAKVNASSGTPPTGDALIKATVAQNVADNVASLSEGHEILSERIHSKKLKIEGAVYDLATGRVTWLP